MHKKEGLVNFQVAYLKPQLFNMDNSAAYMDTETMIPCPSQHYGLPHCKCLLRCFGKCPVVSMPHQETHKYATKTCSKIFSHVYRNISRCTLHEISPY